MTLPAGLTMRLEEAGLDPYYISDFVRAALDEDLDGGGDVTTLATVDTDAEATGDFIARGEGIVAGLAVAEVALWHCGAESIRISQRVALRHDLNGQEAARAGRLLAGQPALPPRIRATRIVYDTVR